MDKIDKTLARISSRQRKLILQATAKFRANQLAYLDIKKIKGNANVFRVRAGQYRIIF